MPRHYLTGHLLYLVIGTNWSTWCVLRTGIYSGEGVFSRSHNFVRNRILLFQQCQDMRFASKELSLTSSLHQLAWIIADPTRPISSKGYIKEEKMSGCPHRANNKIHYSITRQFLPQRERTSSAFSASQVGSNPAEEHRA
jgi:hypothetical protein